ncbi:MAG: protein-glutamate O-methyltransferase CheR, partial [Verrucomicrobiaceae bacterium]
MPEYLAFLRTHPGEAGALLQDLLISVTNFFRDREAFAALEAGIPALFAGKRAAGQVRVWTAGCATGEEAYSVAMLLTEYANTMDSPPSIQVFATDLDENALNQARAGVYTEAIAADVSEERLKRFFTRENGRLRVRTELRERVLFAVHDLFRDTPFSRLDLVTCRNLFIYVNRKMQQSALEVFHFSLHAEGRLFLGSAESADAAPGLFIPFNKKHRIYARSRAPHRVSPPMPEGFKPYAPLQIPSSSPLLSVHNPREDGISGGGEKETGFTRSSPLPGTGFSGPELHLRLLRKVFSPSVVIDADGGIVHLSGPAGRWLAFSDGEPTHNLLRLVHPGLRGDLRTSLLHAAEDPSIAVEVRNVPVEFESGENGRAHLRVCAAGSHAPGYFLVVFSEDGEQGEAPPVEIPGIHAGGTTGSPGTWRRSWRRRAGGCATPRSS